MCLAYPFWSTENGTNFGVTRLLPSARRVSICSVMLTVDAVVGNIAGCVEISTDVISTSPNCTGFSLFVVALVGVVTMAAAVMLALLIVGMLVAVVLLLLLLMLLLLLLLLMLMLLILLLLNILASAAVLLFSSTLNSSEYSGTIFLSTLDSFILKSMFFPYSR